MKKLVLIIGVAFLLLNCNANAVQKPEKLIEKEVMVDIFYDLYLANAMFTADSKYFVDRNLTPSQYVYQKYKIDSLQFVQNDHYYASDLPSYEKLYATVTERLKKNKDLMDTIVAKSPQVEGKKLQEKKVTTPLQVRDSLRKNLLFKSKKDKDNAAD